MPKFSTNQILGKVVQYGDRLIGSTARRTKATADILSAVRNKRGQPLPREFVTRAKREAKVAAGRSFQTRVKTGLGTGVGLGMGIVATKAYQNHQENQILRHIDKLYGTD